MLHYYAQKFATVEINNTFHRFPTEETVHAWAEQVPALFRFVLKARQIITHYRRLRTQSNIRMTHSYRVRVEETSRTDLFELSAELQERPVTAGCVSKDIDGREGLCSIPARELVLRRCV